MTHIRPNITSKSSLVTLEIVSDTVAVGVLCPDRSM